MKKVITYIIILAGAVSCRDSESPPPVVTEDIEVVLRVNLPVLGSRADGDATIPEEYRIDNIVVLAFNAKDAANETYEYIAQGKNMTLQSDPSQAVFKVGLLRRDDPYRFVVLTNAREVTDRSTALIKGTAKDVVLGQLVLSHQAEWEEPSSSSFTPIPMWGETAPAIIGENTTQLTGVELLRMVCRIDALLTTDEAKSKFKLGSVRLYNRKTRGQIAPFTPNVSQQGGNVTAPSLPDDNDGSLTVLNPGYAYNATPGENEQIRFIYTFEAAPPVSELAADATCLVIGGYYDGAEKETFYRVDFTNDDQTRYRALLRNHHYLVNITDVLDEGYPAPGDAFNGQTMNLVGEVIVWDKDDLSDIVFFGPFYISIGNDTGTRTARLQREAGSSYTFAMTTNIDPGNIEITFTGSHYGTTRIVSPGIVENERFRVEMLRDLAGEVTGLKVTALENHDPSDPHGNSQTAVLSAHRCEMVIYIGQHDKKDTDWDDGGNDGHDIGNSE